MSHFPLGTANRKLGTRNSRQKRLLCRALLRYGIRSNRNCVKWKRIISYFCTFIHHLLARRREASHPWGEREPLQLSFSASPWWRKSRMLCVFIYLPTLSWLHQSDQEGLQMSFSLGTGGRPWTANWWPVLAALKVRPFLRMAFSPTGTNWSSVAAMETTLNLANAKCSSSSPNRYALDEEMRNSFLSPRWHASGREARFLLTSQWLCIARWQPSSIWQFLFPSYRKASICVWLQQLSTEHIGARHLSFLCVPLLSFKFRSNARTIFANLP